VLQVWERGQSLQELHEVKRKRPGLTIRFGGRKAHPTGIG